MDNIIQLSMISNLGTKCLLRKQRIYKTRENFFQKYDEEMFIQRFRLSKKSVLFILSKIETKIRSRTKRFVTIYI